MRCEITASEDGWKGECETLKCNPGGNTTEAFEAI